MTNGSGLQLWGGHECTVSRIGDVVLDQTRRSGHHDRLVDIGRFAALGIKSLRYPILWERTSPDHADTRDFIWADERLAEIRRLGINPIVGLVHHGNGPVRTNMLADDFAAGVADHARAVAERYPWVNDWTPINEPLTTARFACLYGLWYPHRTDEGAFWTTLLNEIDATRLSMRVIRAVNPHARLIQTEDLGYATGTAEAAAQVAFENERRWITWDLLAGRVRPGHRLWDRIAEHGLADRLRTIADDPCPADVIGINHYLSSTRFLSHEFDRHPGIEPAIDGLACVNIEAVRVVEGVAGFDALIRQTWARYGSTIAITECHNGSTRDEQMRWFHQTWRTAEAARAAGVDIVAVTAWSLLGAYDWNSLLTRAENCYEPGVFDVRSDPPRPTAMTGLLRALVRGEPPPLAHIVEDSGWWQRDDRYLASYLPAAPGREHRPSGPPILVTGATGTLAKAIAAACAMRGLAYVLSDRATLALDDPASITRAIEVHQPWAVINCAGIVDIDRAEAEQRLCQRINAIGPELLATACDERGIRFVQLSSDQVFDGTKAAPYVEHDPTRALNAYGRAKAEAERRVRCVCPAALVIRTAAFFSPHDRHNFAVDTIDRLVAGGRVQAAGDEHISPTYVPDLVDAMLDHLIDGERGVWHLANDGGVSWAGFARMLARAHGLDDRGVVAVPAASLRRPAARPLDVRLASARGQILPSLESAVARFADAYRPSPSFAVAAE